jgi:hypothetical protein
VNLAVRLAFQLGLEALLAQGRLLIRQRGMGVIAVRADLRIVAGRVR